jgi:peptidoglycan/LPS O-acetylase OafA/YrhL
LNAFAVPTIDQAASLTLSAREAGEAVATSAPSKSASFHIPALDGIRAISFFLVFAAHAGLGHLVPGGFGVTIFFFLSGYLITTLLRIEYDKTQKISFRGFYLRRTLRIFPPFYLVLAMATLLTIVGILQGSLLMPALVSQALYVGNYYGIMYNFAGIAPGTAIFWSLAIEEHFYLVFPLAYLFIRRHLPAQTHQIFVLIGACAVVLIWRCVLVYGLNSPEERTYLGTDTRIDSILWGCILAIYGNPVLDTTRISKRIWLFMLAPLGALLLVGSLLYRDPLFRESFRYTLQGIALIPLFIVAIRYHSSPLFSWLNLRWIRFLGVLSYSLYLVHFVYLYAVNQNTSLPQPIQAILALALSILTATVIHRAIERPIARMRRKLAAA